jgi:hypothetical protein
MAYMFICVEVVSTEKHGKLWITYSLSALADSSRSDNKMEADAGHQRRTSLLSSLQHYVCIFHFQIGGYKITLKLFLKIKIDSM